MRCSKRVFIVNVFWVIFDNSYVLVVERWSSTSRRRSFATGTVVASRTATVSERASVIVASAVVVVVAIRAEIAPKSKTFDA